MVWYHALRGGARRPLRIRVSVQINGRVKDPSSRCENAQAKSLCHESRILRAHWPIARAHA